MSRRRPRSGGRRARADSVDARAAALGAAPRSGGRRARTDSVDARRPPAGHRLGRAPQARRRRGAGVGDTAHRAARGSGPGRRARTADAEVGETRISTYTAQADALAAQLAAQEQTTAEAVEVEVARLVAAGHAAAAEARATLIAAFDEQLQALPAATEESVAAIARAAGREKAAITAAADGERQRLSAARTNERQAAQVHIDDLKQQTTTAGESQAARVTAGSEQRALAITREGAAVPTQGEPPSAEAQAKGNARVAERAADQCRQTGARVADVVRQEAAHHAATNYDGMLRDYLATLDESRPGAEQAIVEFVTGATAKVDEIAQHATAAARALGEQTAATLAREKTDALAEIDAGEAQAPQAIEQAGAQARQTLKEQFRPLGDEVTQSAAANAQQLRSLDAEAQTEAAAELWQNLQLAREQATAALEQLRQGSVGGMTDSFEQLMASLQQTADGRVAAARVAVAKVQEGTRAGGEGAAQQMTEATTSFQNRLTAGVDESLEKLTSGGGEFRTRTEGIHAKALQGLAQAVDDGLKSEDDLLAKAHGEMAALPAKVDTKYTDLKGQAETKSAAEQQAPATRIHRGIWDSITGWVAGLHEKAKKWFADTFGEFLGGLLLGILEGLIIVGIGLLATWALGAIVGFFVASAEVAAIVTVVIAVIAAVGLGIYNRFQEFYADNPGQDAGFWRGLGLVGLGIADLTGIPFIIEGLVGQRAFGAKMSKFDSAERLGMGLVFFGAALVSLKNILRAKPKPNLIEEPRVRPTPEPHPSETPPVGLSPKLEGIRAGLTDPRAVEQFDKMFASLKGNSAKMEGILDGFATKGPIQDRLIADWVKDPKNLPPESPRGDALDRVGPAKAQAQALREEMIQFQKDHPKLPGMADRLKALDGEIEGFDEMLDGRLEASSASVTGREANVDGIRKEFEIAKRTAGLTGLAREFPFDGGKVEVDVVGDGGKQWVEVKATEPFGLDSTAWTGEPGTRGAEAQARRMLGAAQQNPVDGVPPKVRWEFPKGVSKDVRAALEAMGIEVKGPTIEPKPIPVPVPHGGHDDDQNDGGT